MPGMTAYFGLLDVGKPKAGETVVVSGAAGAVGSVVGQIAKIKGCRVVGIAGGAEKCALARRRARLRRRHRLQAEDVARARCASTAPEGIDVYFDNVGGEILDAALAQPRARRAHRHLRRDLAVQRDRRRRGPSNYLSLLVNRARMTGFVVFDYADRYAEAAAEMARLDARTASSSRREDIVDGGVEHVPRRAAASCSRGENIGKLVLKVA